MIGRQEYTPGIINQQEQLESGRPLNGVHQIAFLVDIRNNPAPGLVLDVEIPPLVSAELIKQMLPRTVGGDRDRVAKQHRAGVGGEVPV